LKVSGDDDPDGEEANVLKEDEGADEQQVLHWWIHIGISSKSLRVKELDR
jgi:hypothetical protein